MPRVPWLTISGRPTESASQSVLGGLEATCIGGHQSKLMDEADENDSEGCEHVAATPLSLSGGARG